MHNQWDDITKLNKVIFYLSDVANLRYQNHETDFHTWSGFKASFLDIFGCPAIWKLCTKQCLHTQAQHPGATSMTYSDDVVDLCNLQRFNASMTEAAKI